jgi:RNA polymerase sigma-70 factor, ECF subfamily
MTTPVPEEISQLLVNWGEGDKAALDKLIPLVYGELRRLAQRYMRGERVCQTLQTSALVNEAYLRLVDYRKMRWQDRAHFLAVSAQLMRRILVERARKRGAAKRGGEAIQITLSRAATTGGQRTIDLIALDRALSELAVIDERRSRIVELRYFGGLTIEETAAALEISPATVQREWRIAKAWLHRAVSCSEDHEAPPNETDQ